MREAQQYKNMKKITQEQIKTILNVLMSYNIGVKDYGLLNKMLSELPDCEKDEKEKKD